MHKRITHNYSSKLNGYTLCTKSILPRLLLADSPNMHTCIFLISGWEEEKSVKFHEHVLLERQIRDFPAKGPIRHFMELVTVTLSKNPYLTVQQKHEHIDWFRKYFDGHRDLLEAKLGVNGVIKKQQKIEKGKQT